MKNKLFLAALLLCACQAEEAPEIILQNTAAKISAIRPSGELQVLSALMEDFDQEEIKSSFLSKSCLQILRQRCSYAIDLESIEFTPQISSKKVKVSIMEPQAGCLTQDSPFISDDEDFWAKNRSDAQNNIIKKHLAQKIMSQFATPENQQKARQYGEDFIKKLLGTIDLEAEISWRKKERQ